MSFRRDEPKIRNSSKGSKDAFTKHRGRINTLLEDELSEDEDYEIFGDDSFDFDDELE